MSFLQGGALPNVTETTTATTTPTTTEYSKLLKDVAGAGSTAIGRTGAESIAGYDPLQTMGYNALPGAVNAYQPGLDAAQQTASRAAAGITPGRIQSLMNPYTTNVVNEMARLSQQNVERNLMPSMRSGFVGTGALGSQRYANALGQSMADTQANLTGQQYGALSKGYSEALKGALDEAQLMNLSAKTQGDLAKMQQQLGVEGAGALTKAGAERQGYQQAILDAPMKNAKSAADLLRGYTMPSTETKTFTGPRTRDYYQQSDLGKIGGVLSLIGGAKEGKEGEGLNRLLGILSKTNAKGSSIINSLLNPADASSAAIGQGETEAMKAANVLDDYNKLISGLQNNYSDLVSSDVISSYNNLFDVLGEDDYFTGI